MGDIAERAGLAVGTLYNYFPSKPEIALAIVRGDTSGALAAGEAIVKRPPEGAISAVCSLLDLYLEPFEERPRWTVRKSSWGATSFSPCRTFPSARRSSWSRSRRL